MIFFSLLTFNSSLTLITKHISICYLSQGGLSCEINGNMPEPCSENCVYICVTYMHLVGEGMGVHVCAL